MRRYCTFQVGSFTSSGYCSSLLVMCYSFKSPGCHLLFFRYLNGMEMNLSLCDIIKYIYTKVTKDKLYFDSNYLNGYGH